jgi:hypothetical protein
MKRLTSLLNSLNCSNHIKMRDAQQFNFIEGFDTFGVPDALPQLPLSLSYRGTAVEVVALLDTGASVNVLPIVWGFNWV